MKTLTQLGRRNRGKKYVPDRVLTSYKPEDIVLVERAIPYPQSDLMHAFAEAESVRFKTSALRKFAADYLTWRKKCFDSRLLPQKELVTLKDSDIPLVTAVRNSKYLLPAFLNHYRSLGVTRFAIVDDASTDGSDHFLMEQPDVDLFR